MDKGVASYSISLISAENEYEGTLIPMVDVLKDTTWTRDIYTSLSNWKMQLGEHIATYGKDIMGKKIRVTPTVLGIYEGESREIEIKDTYQ